MSTLALLFLAITVGALCWFGAETFERRRQLSERMAMESRLKYAESRALGYRDQAAALQRKVEAVRADLEAEREQRMTAAMGFHQEFKRGVALSGAGFLLFGLIVGSTVSALWTGWRVTEKTQEKMIQLEVVARVAEMRAGHYQEHLQRLNEQLDRMQQALDEEQAAKVVAMTKLELVMQNLVSDWLGRGFVLDSKKLEKKLEESKTPQNRPADTNAALLKAPVPAL